MILDIQSQLDIIHKIRKGEIKEGLSLGIKSFDTHFRFKEEFGIFLGHSNVGKTHLVLYLMFLYSYKHNLRWLVFSSENEPYSLVKKVIEFKEGLPINKIDEDKLKESSGWVDSHFKFISIEEMQTYKSLLDLGTEIKKGWDYHGFLIDPYNSLEKDRDIFRSVGSHEYDYQVCSEFRMFSSKNKVALWLTTHAVTEALRLVHPSTHEYAGFPIAPRMSHAEGGGKFSNRSNFFTTVHRYVQHPLDWMITELHVLKVKNTDTGGMPTTLLSPIKMRSLINNVGYSIEGENMIELINEHTRKGISKT
jgi:hypothetical protein|tara:strand:- start:90 stop:1007 length:918 start_codon:yes stop_codon:yes gene_type:complete